MSKQVTLAKVSERMDNPLFDVNDGPSSILETAARINVYSQYIMASSSHVKDSLDEDKISRLYEIAALALLTIQRYEEKNEE